VKQKGGQAIGQSKKQSEHSRHESDGYSNQWNRADGSAFGDRLPGRSKTVERRGGRSWKEEEQNELSDSNAKVIEGRGRWTKGEKCLKKVEDSRGKRREVMNEKKPSERN
jgi:hypothetical protein